MISICQYRAAIGCWYSHKNSLPTTCYYAYAPFWSNYVFALQLLAVPVWGPHPYLYVCIFLLILSGDIHPNPGPLQLSDDTNIRLCHLNARSILRPGRLDEVYLELCSLDSFDIIGVSKSHLSVSVPDDDVKLENYNVLRRDQNRHGGGVMLYVHNSLSCTRRSDLELDEIELLWCEIQLSNFIVN